MTVIYRALSRLEAGKGRMIERGCVFVDSALSPGVAEKLEKMGRVAIVHTPPISALPDWAIRSKILVKADIITVEQLVGADASAVAKATKTPEAKIREWQKEILSIFVVNHPKRSG